MVGAKTRASLTSELRRPVPRRARRGLQTKERPMSSYPVQRPLPPVARALNARGSLFQKEGEPGALRC